MDWRTASYSNGNGSCAETASGDGVVVVRDTADRDGGTLSFTIGAWVKFVASLK
jgi:Domain of unknown function (DUF397)